MSKCSICGQVHQYLTNNYNSPILDWTTLYPSYIVSNDFPETYDNSYIEKKYASYKFSPSSINFSGYDNIPSTSTFSKITKFYSLELPHLSIPSNKIYIRAELFEYIKIMFDKGEIDFWDLYELAQIHDFPLINSETEKKAEPSDKVILQITI